MRRKIISVLPALVLAMSLVLVIIPQAEVGAATQNEEFSESDTFVVPETVTGITVQVWGGGGAGGGSTNAGGWEARGGGGGGGGAYASSTLSVTPGQNLQVVVGAGGTGVTGDDGNFGSPSFGGPTTDPDDALVRAAGGSGGTGNTDGGSPEGGAGGTVEDSIGQTKIAGGDGGNGATSWWASSGAGGDGAYGGGSGGAALSSGTSDGNPGNVPGGGGGGARTQRNYGSRAGGAGAAGKVVITWVTYDLTTSSMEGGSVTTPGEDTFTYGEEFVVDLVATPDEGYRFDVWTGDVGTIDDVNAAATNITMNGDYSITANFVKQYDLTISSTEGGSITEPGEDTFTYDEGAVVALVAEANACYEFINWIGDVGTIADIYAASTNITMDAAKNVTANFAQLSYNLTTDSTNGGSVTDPGEGTFTYDCGTVVDLIAEAEEDYRFGEWTGDVSTIADVYASSTTITMSGDYSITANFVKQYDLTTNSTEGGSITEPGEDTFTYDEGTVVDLIAEAEESYRFGKWTGNVSTIADVYAASTTITMNNDYSITANFEVVYPMVATKAATKITATSSTLNMKYAMGEFSPAQVRFAYKKSEGLFWAYTDWVSQSGNGTYAEPVTKLSSNTEYDFKAQLKYNDIEAEGITIQFTTDIPPPSGGCFIATAAYGTPTAEQIDVLREFRDVVLLESTAGSQFVALYYQLSPPVAEFIAGNELLRTLVRELLVDPIVWVVEATEDIWQN